MVEKTQYDKDLWRSSGTDHKLSMNSLDNLLLKRSSVHILGGEWLSRLITWQKCSRPISTEAEFKGLVIVWLELEYSEHRPVSSEET